MKATWKGQVLAESDDTVMVEGNHYFPASALARERFRESATHTVCPWKGTASYYDVVVGDDVNRDAAWYYPTPKSAAANIAGRVAFWKGVQVTALAALLLFAARPAAALDNLDGAWADASRAKGSTTARAPARRRWCWSASTMPAEAPEAKPRAAS